MWMMDKRTEDLRLLEDYLWSVIVIGPLNRLT